MVLAGDDDPQLGSYPRIIVELGKLRSRSPRLDVHKGQVKLGPGQQLALPDGWRDFYRQGFLWNNYTKSDLAKFRSDDPSLFQAMTSRSEQRYDHLLFLDLLLYFTKS